MSSPAETGTRGRRAEERRPWWVVLSSASAPVLLVGGWSVAAAQQIGGFDPVVESISALAASGADRRWIMTSALAGVGVCHLTTALGLRAAAGPGRAVLAAGGVATVLVAAFPLPAEDGSSTAHAIAAGVAFGALAVWPAASWRRGAPTWTLRKPGAVAAAGVLLGLVGWFVAELGGNRLGLAERAAAGAQACWPLVVALSCGGGARQAASRLVGHPA